jgi:hypothetical protein
MTGLADFDLYPGGQAGGNAEARAKDAQNQGIPGPNQLNPTTDTNAEGFESEGFLIVRPNASHHRADPRREFVEPDQAGGWVDTNHSIEK